MADNQTSLSTTPETAALNEDALQNHHGFTDLESYLEDAKRRGVIKGDLTPEQKAAVQATFDRVKNGNA